MKTKFAYYALVAVPALVLSNLCAAQVTVSENFNSATTTNYWYGINGACLTASTNYSTSTTLATMPAGSLPGCVTTLGTSNTYYKGLNSTQIGGATGAALPDTSGHGALRLTNGSLTTGSNGNNETGLIASTSPFPSNSGLQITFNTVTYGGNAYNGGKNNTGADGISFFLVDSSYYTPTTATLSSGTKVTYYPVAPGSYGGSLGYDCSPSKGGGIAGAYIGLGIDEYGNFVNKGDNGLATDPLSPGYSPSTIGLRGAGNITSYALTTAGGFGNNAAGVASPVAAGPIATPALTCNYGYYTYGTPTNSSSTTVSPRTLPSNNQIISTTPNSNKTSATVVWATNVSSSNGTYTQNTATYSIWPVIDYPLIAYKVLPTNAVNNGMIQNQEATSSSTNTTPAPSRQAAIPISYSLTLTKSGKLSLSYSYNNGILIPVLTPTDITGSGANGPLPANFLFGFSAGTGGGSNVHEITCFKAAQINESESSAAGNVPQNTRIKNSTGNFIYLAAYNPVFWTGTVTATAISANTDGSIVIASTPTWDANCALTGTASFLPANACPAGSPSAPQTPSARPIATWNAGGVTLAWGSLNSTQQGLLNAGDSTPMGSQRIDWVHGVRSNESATALRQRNSLLGDIINASPVWVGTPQSPFDIVWSDLLYPTAPVAAENSASVNYNDFTSNNANRLNVIYAGANDGMLHGFAAGAISGSGSSAVFDSTKNTGQEVLAYVPSLALATLHSTSAELDLSNQIYAHNDFVDATPGVGDIYYKGAWHTWLVGGLGAGGQAGGVIGDTSTTTVGNLYALDITSPSTANTDAQIASSVIGDWTSSNITCANANVTPSGCGAYLGAVYGTPVIRRLHNGNWGVIFGNGLNSSSGTAGIFIMEVDIKTGATSFDYIDTGAGASGGIKNGIAYVTAADLDGDHITDYVYAGDVLGNVWRFDLTGKTSTLWTGATPFKLFQTSATAGAQPITSALSVQSVQSGSQTLVMVDFGTGRMMPQTLSSAQTFASGAQYLYGIMDWNMDAWNAISTTQYVSQPAAKTSIATTSNLTQQTLSSVVLGSSSNASGTSQGVTDTSYSVCFAGTTATCSGAPNPSFGWYIQLPNSTEQVVYNPTVVAGVFFVNSTIGSVTDALQCTVTQASGFSYAIDAGTGGGTLGVFNSITGTPTTGTGAANIVGLGLNGVGTPYFVTATGTTTVNGQTQTSNVVTMITQTSNGKPVSEKTDLGKQCNGSCAGNQGKRLSWLELR